MISCPETLMWKKGRHVALNLLGALAYVLLNAVVIVTVVFFAFIGAIFSLALKR